MSTAKAWKTGVKTGGKVIIMLDDIPLAFAQSARFRDDYGLEPVHIIGQLQTIEYVPMHARHEIQISTLVLRNTSLVEMGLEPATAGSFGHFDGTSGKALGAGVVPSTPTAGLVGAVSGANGWQHFLPTFADSTFPNYDSSATSPRNIFTVLHTKVFDICVMDAEFTNVIDATLRRLKPLLVYQNCFFAGGDVSVDANRTLVHNVTFYAQNKSMKGSSLQSKNITNLGAMLKNGPL